MGRLPQLGVQRRVLADGLVTLGSCALSMLSDILIRPALAFAPAPAPLRAIRRAWISIARGIPRRLFPRSTSSCFVPRRGLHVTVLVSPLLWQGRN